MIKKLFISIFMFFQVFLINFSLGNVGNDMLDEAFSKSTQYQIITSKKAISRDDKVKKYITNATQLMLKFAVIIGVIVFLYGGIRFLLSMGDDSKGKKTRDTLIVSGIGLIIAFGAYVILELISSIGYTLGN